MTTFFIYQFRTQNERETETGREWMHDTRAFQAFTSVAAAISAAREALQEDLDGLDPEDYPQKPVIETWNTADYNDGAWFEATHPDGTEYDSGRVLVHTVEIP